MVESSSTTHGGTRSGRAPYLYGNSHIKNLDDISNFNTDSRLDLYIEIHNYELYYNCNYVQLY